MHSFYNNKHLIRLKDKIPIDKNWTVEKQPRAVIEAHQGNLGWALGNGYVVVDIDPRNGGDESYKKLGIDLKKHVATPSGGWHCYYTLSDSYKLHKNISAYPGIDILSTGTQCVISLPKNGYEIIRDLNVLEPLPQKIIDLYSHKAAPVKQTITQEIIEDGIYENRYNTAQISKFLESVDPDESYERWIQIGHGLKRHFLNEGKESEGLKLWNTWSQKGAMYKNGECAEKWKTFKPNRTNIDNQLDGFFGISTVDDEYIKQLQQRIEQAAVGTDLLAILKKQKGKYFDGIARAEVVESFKLKFKKLRFKLDIATIRSCIQPPSLIPEFKKIKEMGFEDWIYIQESNVYLNKLSGVECTEKGFENACNHLVPEDGEGKAKPGARKYLISRNKLNTVGRVEYMPWTDEEIVTRNEKGKSVKILNTYNPKSRVTPEKPTEEGQRYIKLFEYIILELCNGQQREAELVRAFFASCVKNPGQLINWALLIQSKPRMGKTYLTDAVSAILGEENASPVSNNSIKSKFNGYAQNKCLNVVEELGVNSKESADVLDALKPLITNRRVDVVEKYKPAKTVYNTANYVFLTNNVDSITMEPNDRRFFVINCGATDPEKSAKKAGFDTAQALFNYLYKNLDKYKSMLAHDLMYRDLSDEFEEHYKAVAPYTEYKKSMQSLQESRREGHLEIENIIDKKEMDCHNELLSFAALRDLCRQDGLTLSSYQISKILISMGFKHEGRFRIKGKKCIIYHKFTDSSWYSANVDQKGKIIRQKLDELNTKKE